MGKDGIGVPHMSWPLWLRHDATDTRARPTITAITAITASTAITTTGGGATLLICRLVRMWQRSEAEVRW